MESMPGKKASGSFEGSFSAADRDLKRAGTDLV
jgi:hypothetical protein